MSYTQRKYRTNLAMKAKMFLDGKDFDCTVVDLSTSGAKIEIKPGILIKNTTLLSELVRLDDVVNFEIAELYLDGEAKITRKEILFDNFYLSIVFENIFYGLKHVPYQRSVYRSRYRSIGKLTLNDQSYEFISHNLSTKGMLLAVFERLKVNNGDLLNIDLEQLNLHADAQLIWTKKLYNHNLLGVKYTKLAQPVKGIAAFARE
jgi:PilZ domain